MKYKIIFFICLISTIYTYGQQSYKDLLEPNSKLVSYGANYSIEKVNSKEYNKKDA